MEQRLCIWMRLCIFFGIYLKLHGFECGTQDDCNFGWAKPKKGSGWGRPNSNQLLSFYIFFIAAVVCGLYVHGLYWRDSLPTLVLTWVATVILFSFQVLTNLLILMEAVCRRRQHDHFLLLLEDIEVSLRLRLRLDVRSNELVRSLHYLVSYLIILSLVDLILFSIASLWLNYIGFFWNGLWSILTMRVRIIQLLVYVRTLQHYLDCLRVKLQQIVAYRMAPQRQLLDIDYGRLGSLEYLLAVKDIYELIGKAFHLLNYFGGWSLFGIIICYLLEVTCNIYWTLLSLDGFSNRQNYYIAGPLAMLPLLIIIWHLCYLCDKCKELDRTITSLVNRINILSSIKPMTLYRLVSEQFAAQVQLQHTEVTAHGFFVLETRLWLTIFTVTATNLVILDQFLQLELELLDIK